MISVIVFPAFNRPDELRWLLDITVVAVDNWSVEKPPIVVVSIDAVSKHGCTVAEHSSK